MSPWATLPFIALGVLIVLLPVGIIGLAASKLAPARRTGYLVLYGGALFLFAVVAADIMGLLPDRSAVDLVLVAGGVLLGIYAAEVIPVRWWDRSHHHGKNGKREDNDDQSDLEGRSKSGQYHERLERG